MYLEQLQKTVSLKLFCFRIFWVGCEKRSKQVASLATLMCCHLFHWFHYTGTLGFILGFPLTLFLLKKILFSWSWNVHKNNYSSSRSISTFLPTHSYLRHEYYITVYVSFSCPDIHLTICTDWFTPVIPYQTFNIAEIKQKKICRWKYVSTSNAVLIPVQV